MVKGLKKQVVAFLLSSFNGLTSKTTLPSILKQANATPDFKKGDRILKDNCGPISILPNLSKIFERCIFPQISSFIDPILSKFQCGFRECYSTQHCLLAILEKLKAKVYKGESFGTILTDLSKPFDYL